MPEMRAIGKIDYHSPTCPRCFKKELNYKGYEMSDDTFRQDIYCVSCKLNLIVICEIPKYWEMWTDDNVFHINEVEKSTTKNRK